MPKSTFFNLPGEKRQGIEQAALDEFSAYGFDNSNMNRIVAHSGIAKGSFYQYFENKKDLYFHLVDMLFQKKMRAVAPIMHSCGEHSFSDNLQALVAAGLALAREDTRLYQLGEDFATMQRPFMAEFAAKYESETMDIYTILLSHAKAKDELRAGMDLPLVSLFISGLVSQATTLQMQQRDDDRRKEHITKEMLAFIKRAILKQDAQEVSHG